jgi:hypothetical protein
MPPETHPADPHSGAGGGGNRSSVRCVTEVKSMLFISCPLHGTNTNVNIANASVLTPEACITDAVQMSLRYATLPLGSRPVRARAESQTPTAEKE